MKKTILLLLAGAMISCTAGRAIAQDAETMKKWMDYMTPGDMHKMLASMDGKWTEDITMWMDPAQPPIKTTSTSEYKMILGGRYQQSNVTGSFNGAPYESQQILAYDNAKKVFICSWIDNMGTGILTLEGPYNAATKTITLIGDEVDPSTGKNMKVRETVKMTDNNNQLIEMYSITGGKEVKTMEIRVKRM